MPHPHPTSTAPQLRHTGHANGHPCMHYMGIHSSKTGQAAAAPDVKTNEVLMWCGNNDPMTMDLIHKELHTYLPEYNEMKQWCILHWLGSEETIHTKNFASIVIDLTNKHDRDTLLEIA